MFPLKASSIHFCFFYNTLCNLYYQESKAQPVGVQCLVRHKEDKDTLKPQYDCALLPCWSHNDWCLCSSFFYISFLVFSVCQSAYQDPIQIDTDEIKPQNFAVKFFSGLIKGRVTQKHKKNDRKKNYNTDVYHFKGFCTK